MSNNTTATVETITAEVRTLMVGSRQVTASVYGQLDEVPHNKIIPFGRVMPKDAETGYVYVAGKHAETGELVRARTPCSATAIGRHVRGVLNSAGYDELEKAVRGETWDAGKEDQAAEKQEAEAVRLLADDSTGYGSVAHYQRDAEKAEGLSERATTEVERLRHLADAARARYEAAVARKRGKEHQAASAKHREAARKRYGEATRCGDGMQTLDRDGGLLANRLTALADEWTALPLIVLAGLR